MATSAGGQSYGTALPDQVDRITNFFDAHLEVIGDIRELYKERVLLERDYAAKLQLLAKKAADKKSKSEASIVLGNDPTKNWDGATLKKSTLNNAYTTLITSVVNTSQNHANLADSITAQVVDALKGVEKRNEDMKKKELTFFQKLLADRDKVYADRLKNKQKYDEECVEVESQRSKQGRATDDKHAERAAKHFEQQENEMLNSKNVYLISTTTANKAKGKFYEEDLPGLEDHFQLLQTYLVRKLVGILKHAQALQSSHLDACKAQLGSVEKGLNEVNPVSDQNLFVEHNIRPFIAPGDWSFEPCGSHYDTDTMSTDPAPKVVLQNKLSLCRGKIADLKPLVDAKSRELEKLSRLFHAYYDKGQGAGNIDQISDNYLDTKQQLTLYKTSLHLLQAEVDTILAALGGDIGAQQPHAFKSSTFTIPTQCGYCKSSIWGLNKQGKTCKQCGLSVHGKCELKVPANCGQPQDERAPPKTARTTQTLSRVESKASSIRSTSSTLVQTPTPSSFRAEVSSADSQQSARILFEFTPTSPFELAVSEGELVNIIEEDDGSGWIKVVDAEGGKGLVPATYVEVIAPSSSKSTLATRASPKQGSGKYVRGIYEYTAQGSDELGLREGEIVELTPGPSGGENYGEGWWEGINSKGKKGIFPSNYVEYA